MKILFLIGIGLMLNYCSPDIVKKENSSSKLDSLTIEKNKETAQEHFMNGALEDMSENYAKAIIEYEEALRFDNNAGIHYALAKDYLRLNKLATSLFHAKESVKLDYKNTEYQWLLGEIYTSANNIDSAMAVFKRITQLDSTNIDAYYNLGMLYSRDNKPLKALSTYKNLLDKIGPEWNVLIKIAELNERLGNIPETIKTIEDILKLNPGSLEIQKILFDAYIKSNQPDKALSKIDEAMQVFPEDITLIEFRAKALIQKGKWEDGANEYQKLIRNEKVSFKDKLKIGTAFLAKAAKDSSFLNIAKGMLHEIEQDSSDWQINFLLGQIEQFEKNDSLATEYFRKSSELGAWNSDTWVRLGTSLFDTGHYEDAAMEMEKAVINFPDDFIINLVLGLSYSQLNRHSSAEKYLEKAVELNDKDITALSAYGFTLNQLNKEDKALIFLNEGLKLDPDNIQLLGIVGLIYDSKKMYEKSDKVYEKALSMDSTNIVLLNNYAYSLSERGIKLKEALQMVSSALDQDANNSSYLDTKGWVLFKLGEYELAIEFIEKAIEQDKNDATLYEHLGHIYLKLEDYEKAKESWMKGLEIEPDNKELKELIQKEIK